MKKILLVVVVLLIGFIQIQAQHTILCEVKNGVNEKIKIKLEVDSLKLINSNYIKNHIMYLDTAYNGKYKTKNISALQYIKEAVEIGYFTIKLYCKNKTSFEPIPTGNKMYFGYANKNKLFITLNYKAQNGYGNYIISEKTFVIDINSSNLNEPTIADYTAPETKTELKKNTEDEIDNKKIKDKLEVDDLAYKKNIITKEPRCLNCDSIIKLISLEPIPEKFFKRNDYTVTMQVKINLSETGNITNYKIGYCTEISFKSALEKYINDLKFEPAKNMLNENLKIEEFNLSLNIKN
jgi:hypothetical protein